MDTINIYKKQSKNYYVSLSRKEKRELYNKMIAGDEDAKNDLINSALPLVIKVAAKWHKRYKKIIGLDDLIQIGNLAVARLIMKYNPKYELSTFVTRIVSNAIIDEVMSNTYNINAHVNLTKYASKNITKIKELNTNNIDEIQKATNINPKKIKQLLDISNIKREKIPKNENVSRMCMSNNINGCLADMIHLLNENVESKEDREVFMTYVKYIDKPNKIRLVARDLVMSPDKIKIIVNQVKKTLKSSFSN